MTVTITKLYDHYDRACDAVRALELSGIASNDISIVAADEPARRRMVRDDHSGAATGATAGAVVGGGAGLLTGLGLMAIPGVGPVVAAGWLTSLAAGAAVGAGAGGLIGALTDHGVDESDAQVYSDRVRRGATLISARVADDRRFEIEEIMARYKAGAHDVAPAAPRTYPLPPA